MKGEGRALGSTTVEQIRNGDILTKEAALSKETESGMQPTDAANSKYRTCKWVKDGRGRREGWGMRPWGASKFFVTAVYRAVFFHEYSEQDFLKGGGPGPGVANQSPP